MASTSITDGLNAGTSLQDILEATYGDMSAEFQSRIAGVFDEAHLAEFGKALFNYQPGPNEFLYSLINHIGLVNVNYRSFSSPLKAFKKGWMEFGDTIEDIYIEPVKALLYEPEVPNDNPGDQWKTFKPDIDVVYYKKNRELVYPLTVNERAYKRAFMSYRELDKFLSGLMTQLANADEIDDFNLTLELLNAYADMDGINNFYQVKVDNVTDEISARKLVMAVRALVPTMKYPSRKFNAKGVLNWSRPEDLYLLVTPQVNAVLDVEVLAKAFNMNKAEFMGNVVEVPYLPKDAVALLVDKEFFQIYDTFMQMTTTGMNALHLTTNYFYHHQGILATSPFYPAVMFTTADAGTPTQVKISGSAQIEKGRTYPYTALVTDSTGTNPVGATQAVEWEIVGAPQYASINQNGNLTVMPKFSGSSLTIKATSVEDSKISNTFAITIKN